MTLSVIIVNYNYRGLLKQCLKGIAARFPRDLEYEVIVVDNGSDDGSDEMMRQEFLHVRYLKNKENLGLSKAINRGYRQSRGRYLLLMNPDISIVPGSIEAMLDYIERHAFVGVLGPRLVNPDGSHQYSYFRFYRFWTPVYRRTMLGRLPWGARELERFLMKDALLHEPGKVDWLLGAALLVRRSVFEQVGGMDERYFLYFEDTDLCRSVKNAGFEVHYTPGAHFIHYYGRSSRSRPLITGIFSRSTRAHIMSWIRYFRKWRHSV